MKIYPFTEGDAFATFRNLIEKVTQEIHALDNEYVLKVAQTELEDYYLAKVTMQPLTLHADQYYIENQAGTQIDVTYDFRRAVFPGERAMVRGTRLDIAVPYEGDPVLWRIRPSTCSLSGYPELEVRDDAVVFSVRFPDDSADTASLKSEIDRQMRSLMDAVQSLRHDVENHNRSAPQTVRSAM
jgi:hypothetical protein